MCGHPRHHAPHGYGCCCADPGAWGPAIRRRFATREERIARLEEYLKELQAEVQAVQERIAELKASR
ncbi:MAG: DUF5320 domain-containing protein [Chloroflexia bacterium]